MVRNIVAETIDFLGQAKSDISISADFKTNFFVLFETQDNLGYPGFK